MANPILTEIESLMKSSIEGMTTAGGYNFNWGTVNREDMALVTFPMAEIMLENEENLDPDDGACANSYHNRCTFLIMVRTQLTTESDNPTYASHADLNKALDDLKKVFGQVNVLSNAGAFRIMYVGAERVNEMSGDIFVPKRMETRWEVDYYQDRSTVTQVGGA